MKKKYRIHWKRNLWVKSCIHCKSKFWKQLWAKSWIHWKRKFWKQLWPKSCMHQNLKILKYTMYFSGEGRAQGCKQSADCRSFYVTLFCPINASTHHQQNHHFISCVNKPTKSSFNIMSKQINTSTHQSIINKIIT